MGRNQPVRQLGLWDPYGLFPCFHSHPAGPPFGLSSFLAPELPARGSFWSLPSILVIMFSLASQAPAPAAPQHPRRPPCPEASPQVTVLMGAPCPESRELHRDWGENSVLGGWAVPL